MLKDVMGWGNKDKSFEEMMCEFTRYNVPLLKRGAKVLVVGASGGIGFAVVGLLLNNQGIHIGAHYRQRKEKLDELKKKKGAKVNLKLFKADLNCMESCDSLINSFIKWADGINGLVVLCGGITRFVHWKELDENSWNKDINLNLSVPFFLARTAMKSMEGKGGKVILVSTESALHGGGSNSLAYGVAKAGIECLIKGLAKDGARFGINVNGVRPGFIASGFHQRWQKKSKEDIEKRIEMIPFKRAGHPIEVAALVVYLLSPWADFITGQTFAITGGDWL